MSIKASLAATYFITSFHGTNPALKVEKHLAASGEILKTLTLPHSLDTQAKDGLKVVILGDTGCRLRGKEIQNCLDPAEWPLENLLKTAAAEKPDFIIHVGDYHYRVSCNHPSKCEPFKNTVGYTWESWVADWFSPAQSLNSIPVLFARGNHENCRRAWLHWQKYLSPDSNIESCRDVDPLQFVDLGDILLVNLDVSGVSDEPLPEDSVDKEKALASLKLFLEQSKLQIQKITQNTKKKVWLILHKPPYGAVPYKEKESQEIFWDSGTPRLQLALEETGFNDLVDLYISGHIHNGQVVQGKHALQIVTGESGTSLEPIGDYSEKPLLMKNGSTAFIPTAHDKQFGYMTLELSQGSNTKTLKMKSPEGLVEAECQLGQFSATCVNTLK